MMRKIAWLILSCGVAAAQLTSVSAANCHRSGSGESDCRENMQASFFSGLAVDTFAAAEDLRYANRSAASSKHERAFAGFEFGYRAAGARHSRRQLWIYGEAVHGVRSAEAGCAGSGLEACGDPGTIESLMSDPTRKALLIIRNATTLEGALGFRLEILRLHAGEESPASVYASAEARFIKLAGGPGDAADVHHLGAGVLSTHGLFRGSYVEAGWGRNDLFPSRSRDRWRVDARLVRRIGATPTAFFARMMVDSDLGAGSDTIQSYVGLEFDLRRFSRRRK